VIVLLQLPSSGAKEDNLKITNLMWKECARGGEAATYRREAADDDWKPAK
jgi:hypothetical protein